VILIIWIYAGSALMKLCFSENDTYLIFLDKSMMWRIISGIFLYLIMVLIYYLIIYYIDNQERLDNEAKLKEIIKESELNLLKSQINPHFLFNSLNSISSLTITDALKAQEMIIKLSDFLRYSISNPGNMFSTLGSELENIRRYLEIEKIRFGDKLFFDFQIEESCYNLEIPVMIFQPLFENAVKHGVYESIGQIFVKTSCENSGNKLVAVIENNFESNIKSKQGAGIGLNNIRERLKLIYRNDQLLQTAVKGDIFQVKLIIPQILKENEDVDRKIKSTDY
jgi:two-component system LytT family sensor kinase